MSETENPSSQDFADFYIPQDMPLSVWRQQMKDVSTEEMEEVISELERRNSSETEMFIEVNGENYITRYAQNVARHIIIPEIRSKKYLAEKLSSSSESDKKIIENMQVNTFGPRTSIIVDKIESADKLKEQAREKLGSNPNSLVYFASHTDIEMALLTGAKEIHLVDPVLGDEVLVKKMLERISRYADDSSIEYNDKNGEINISINGEIKNIYIHPQTMEDFVDKSQEKYDAVLLFNKEPFMEIETAKSVLAENGVYIDNRQ